MTNFWTVRHHARCVLSSEAVATCARKAIHRICRLEDGYPEWKAAGLPIK
jgi:ArsR family transcriptional regulator